MGGLVLPGCVKLQGRVLGTIILSFGASTASLHHALTTSSWSHKNGIRDYFFLFYASYDETVDAQQSPRSAMPYVLISRSIQTCKFLRRKSHP